MSKFHSKTGSTMSRVEFVHAVLALPRKVPEGCLGKAGGNYFANTDDEACLGAPCRRMRHEHR